MNIKNGYPLTSVKGFRPKMIKQLSLYSISTVEEFLSHYAHERNKLSNALGMSLSDLSRLADLASKSISVDVRYKLFQYISKPHPMGAKPPDNSDTDHFKDK